MVDAVEGGQQVWMRAWGPATLWESGDERCLVVSRESTFQNEEIGWEGVQKSNMIPLI